VTALRLARLAALMAAIPASAAQFTCLPSSVGLVPIPGAAGTHLRYASADTGFWLGWWCPAPPPPGAPADKSYFKQNTWAVLTAYKNASADPMGAIQSAASAADALANINALADAARVTPAAGSTDLYNLNMLYWSACQALSTPPIDFLLPDPIPAGYCGAQPVPPPPPAPPPPPPPPPPTLWEVIPDGTKPTRAAYPAVQDATGKWKRASTTSNVSVPALTPCDCQAIDIFEYNITHYCKVPAAPVPQVSACRVKK
jgi:hypothetical protein